MSTEESVMPTHDTTVSYGSSGILFNCETGYYTFDGFVIAQKLNNNVASYGAAGITSIAGFSAKADTLSGIIGLGINALQSIEFKADDDTLKEKAESGERHLLPPPVRLGILCRLRRKALLLYLQYLQR
mgnify:CR=1 FL=1